MHRGYFAIWRKIEDHPFYKEPREFSKYEAWIDILMNAQHDKNPQDVIIGMNVLVCNYGECLKSNVTWSKKWNWSEPKVRRFLKLLQKMNQIRLKSEGITTRISVINYESYDPKRRASDEQVTRLRRDCDEQVTTDKNVKNVKNEKNIYSSESDEMKLSNYLFSHILKNNPKAKPPNFQKWSKDFNDAIRIDERSVDDLKSVIAWCQNDSFWKSNILSAKKLREKFDALYMKMTDTCNGVNLKPQTYAQAQDLERRQMARMVLDDMEKRNGKNNTEGCSNTDGLIEYGPAIQENG